jgi:hypothetical protein
MMIEILDYDNSQQNVCLVGCDQKKRKKMIHKEKNRRLTDKIIAHWHWQQTAAAAASEAMILSVRHDLR